MRLEGKRIVALFLSLQHVTLGFAPIHPPSKTGVSTPLTKLASDASSDQNEPDVVPYGEQSRSYRRDVFGYEDWLRHRRSDRFLYNLSTIPSSGLWRQVKEELWTVFGISSLVVLWNALFCYGYTDLDGVFWNPIVYPSFPELQLPIMPFQLLVPSLSLLLVFRTNASYGRWAEARQQWSTMETECRNIMRMAAAWSSPSREPSREARIQAIRGVGDGCFVFLRSLLRHVSGPDDEEDYLRDIAFLPAQEADAISAAANRPFRALYYLSRKVEALPLSERQRVELDKACVIIGDTCGGTERIYGTPVPTSYSRHTSRFATVWLFLLPFGLYEPFEFTWNHVGLIPVTVLISAFLFIIEELSIQLEEPFSVLALPNIVSDVQAFANQLPQWHAMYTNEEFNSKVYGGEEVPTNFKVGRYNKYSRPKPRSRPIPDDGEDLPFFVKFKWMMSKVPDAGPTLDTAPYYSFSLSEEAGNLLKDMENDEDFSYTPSFEDFIDIPQQRREFTIRQMQELVNEMGTLEKMVRGQDQQLVGIRSSLKELGDRAIKLKDRSTGRTIEVTDIPPLDTAVSGNNDAGTEQSSAIDEISDDMMSDVKSIEDMVKATNTDIGDLRDRIESLQSKADAAKTRASSESSNEASVTPGDTTSRISKEEVEYEESLSNALMMSGELRDDLLCLRNEFDNKFNEVQSLQNRIHTLQDVAHNLQTRVNENSASGEDIEYFIRNQRKKLEIEREEHLIESSATPNGVNKSGTPEPAIPQPVAKINCNASNGSSGDQVISLASEVRSMKDTIHSKTLELTSARDALKRLSDRSRDINKRR